MKRKTRKKLLESLDAMRWKSRTVPVQVFKIEFWNEYGVPRLPTESFFNIDELVSRLMDLSLTQRIVKISSSDFIFTKGMCVLFSVMPDKDNLTNIDAEFMEKIIKLEVKPI